MPIRGYVWKPTEENWGHASLELSDSTYISWWPEDEQQKLEAVFGSAKPDLSRTLSSDIRSEGGRQPLMFVLPDELGLNEVMIKEWWKEMRNKGTWNLLGNNCCAAVKNALAVGGLLVLKQPVETPNGMVEFFEYLVKLVACAGEKKKKKKTTF